MYEVCEVYEGSFSFRFDGGGGGGDNDDDFGNYYDSYSVVGETGMVRRRRVFVIFLLLLLLRRIDIDGGGGYGDDGSGTGNVGGCVGGDIVDVVDTAVIRPGVSDIREIQRKKWVMVKEVTRMVQMMGDDIVAERGLRGSRLVETRMAESMAYKMSLINEMLG